MVKRNGHHRRQVRPRHFPRLRTTNIHSRSRSSRSSQPFRILPQLARPTADACESYPGTGQRNGTPVSQVRRRHRVWQNRRPLVRLVPSKPVPRHVLRFQDSAQHVCFHGHDSRST